MLPKKKTKFVDSQERTNIPELNEFNNTHLFTPYTKQETLDVISSTKNSIGVITYETMMRAPADFFNRYDSTVEILVQRVRERLSEDNNSEVIANLQSNPTSKKLKEKANSAVSLAISNYSDSAQGQNLLAKFDTNEHKVIKVLVMNEILGLGPFEPLWDEPSITEIIANGPNNIQVEISGIIYDVASGHFRNSKHLMDLISRLYASINKELTVNNPIVKGRLHDKSRMMAVHTVVAPEGPNFNIRRHTAKFVSPEDIVRFGTADEKLMEYLGNLIYSDVSYLIIGGTGTGKTTLLNALTGFIRENKRGLTLEDNLELKPHPYKKWAAAMETIDPKPGAANDSGVTMRNLVRAATQLRPETIIIGEVTDSAAYDLCQALNTGHDGASTVHANDANEGMYRLMSLISQSELVKEHAAYDLIAAAFDIVICVERFTNIDGSRKIVSVSEVDSRPTTDSEGNKMLGVTPLWEFEADSERTIAENKVVGQWNQVGELSERTRKKLFLDLRPKKTWEELKKVAWIDPKDLEEKGDD